MGEVPLWGIEFRVQDAGARRVSNAEGMCRIVRKHDCALPAQCTKHSNAGGHSLGFELGLASGLGSWLGPRGSTDTRLPTEPEKGRGGVSKPIKVKRLPNANECPRALLCLVYCAGRAQSCFLTILRIPSALLTRLAPASCTLHPEFYTPQRHLTHAYVHTPLRRVITSTCIAIGPVHMHCTPQQAHAP